MRVVAQKLIWNEYGYNTYLSVFSKYVNLFMVEVIPFTTTLQPDVDFVPDFVTGSGRLINIARERGWPTFRSFGPVHFELFPKEMWVNGEGWESTIGELDFRGLDCVFIKPFKEKLFNAGVVEYGRPVDEQIQMTKTLDEMVEDLVWVMPSREMGPEYRFFVVGGQVVTGSLYKQNGRGIYSPIQSNSVIGQNVKSFLGTLPSDFTAAVDIEIVDQTQLKIVELNNLNSAGFYESDYDALSRALVNYLS